MAMMKIRSINLFIKEGALSLFKNRLMTLASIMTIASCILLLIFSACTVANVKFALKQIESSVGIGVFPVDDISDEDLAQMEKDLNNIRNVVSVTYISPDKALEDMKSYFGEDGYVLKGLETDNPLSRSFEVKIKSASSSKQVITDIKDKIKNVRKTKEATEVINFLIHFSNFLSILSVLVVVFLSVISVVIVMNTIKLTVYVRRKEINIMKYVGATDWFIRWPFVIEGIFIGILGSSIPLIISWLTYVKMLGIAESITVLTTIFTPLGVNDIFPILVPICLCGGTLLGMCGSLFSVRKHLNV